MTASNIQTRSVVALILGLLCLVAIYFVYSKVWPSYTQEKFQLNAAKTENDRLVKALNSLEAFVETYKDTVKNVPNVDLALPHKHPDVPNYVSNLADLAAQSGVALAGLQINESDEPAAQNAIQTMDVSFGATGNYTSLREFLSRIQTNLRLMDVNHINIGVAEDSDDIQRLQYQINLKTYFQK